jgi:hypothetical protein
MTDSGNKIEGRKSVDCAVNTLFSFNFFSFLSLCADFEKSTRTINMRQRYFTDNINSSAQFRIHGMLDKLSTYDFMYTVHSGASCSYMASSYGTKNSGVELIYCRDMGAGCFTFLIHKLVEIHIFTVSLPLKCQVSKMVCCVAECLIPDVLKHHSAFTFRIKQPKNSHTGK